jgi:hypothetical protein
MMSELGDETINKDILEGLVSCLMKDTESILPIKALAKEIDIDGELLINLIEMT